MFGYVNVCLGDIAVLKVGTKPAKIENIVTDYKYINAGAVNSGYVTTYNCPGDTVTTPSRGQGGIGYVGYNQPNFGSDHYAIK